MRAFRPLACCRTALLVAFCLWASAVRAQTALGAWIVKDHQAQARIVISPDAPPMVKLAAAQLQAHLQAIAGATLPILDKPAAADDASLVTIFVGDSPQAASVGVTSSGLTNDAYRIVSGDRWLALIGDDKLFVPPSMYPKNRSQRAEAQAQWEALTGQPWREPFPSLFKNYNKEHDLWAMDGRGSANAVFAYLRSLGAEWFMPGEVGRVLPQTASIPLPEINRQVHAQALIRFPIFYGKNFNNIDQDELLWQLQLGINRGASVMGIAPNGHGLSWLMDHPGYFKAHPDHYALYGGQRVLRKHDSAPCLSSDGLRQQNVAFIDAVFKHFDVPSISVMPPDGYIAACQCPRCEGKATPDRGWRGQLSDYVWQYVNQVAQDVHRQHPGKFITNYAYGGYRRPPLTLDKLSPNLIVGYVNSRRGYQEPEKLQEAIEDRKQWRSKFTSPDQKFIIWEHQLWARPQSYAHMPVYYPHAIAQDIQAVRDCWYGDFVEVYRDAEDRHLIVDSLNLYVMTRLWWDTRQDVHTLIDQYCRSFYGPAAPAARAFIDYGEKHWRDMINDPNAIDKAFELVAKVVQAAPEGTAYAQRAQLLADYIEPLKDHRTKLTSRREAAVNMRIAWRGKEPITLDGKLDEKDWQVGKHALKDVVTGEPPKAATTCIAMWKPQGLHLGIIAKAPDKPVLSATSNEDPAIWNGDCIDILLETQSHTYYQITISPDGKVIDLDRNQGFNSIWTSDVKVATHMEDGQWSMEIIIPMADERANEFHPDHGVAGRRPSQNFPWYINVCRQRMTDKGPELTAISPTGKKNFHVTEKFARLWVK